MNRTSTIRKTNPVAFVFAQNRGSISHYRDLLKNFAEIRRGSEVGRNAFTHAGQPDLKNIG